MSEDVILVDLGTGFVKINTYNDEFPLKFTSKVGIPRFSSIVALILEKYEFDQNIPSYQGILKIKDVFSSKQFHKEDIFKKFLMFIFGRFSSILENSTLILGTPVLWSEETINTVKSFLFQQFNINRIVSAPSSKFSLYFYDIENCTVLDLGHDQTRVIQYQQRKPIKNSVKSSEIAGKHLSEYLLSLLQTKFTPIKNKQFQQLVEEIKTTKTYFVENFEEILQSKNLVEELKETINIPNFNESLNLGIEKILVPELLFKPFLGNNKNLAVDQLLIETLKETHHSLRRELFATIIVFGGSSKFPSFLQRLKRDFNKIPLLASSTILHDSKNADIIPWLGMKKFVQQGLHIGAGKTQTEFFAKL